MTTQTLFNNYHANGNSAEVNVSAVNRIAFLLRDNGYSDPNQCFAGTINFLCRLYDDPTKLYLLPMQSYTLVEYSETPVCPTPPSFVSPTSMAIFTGSEALANNNIIFSCEVPLCVNSVLLKLTDYVSGAITAKLLY